MSRSPLAYPLARGIDSDSGGAADLQTDIMRFMAILSLCLVAIFALVQSIPLAPEVRPEVRPEIQPEVVSNPPIPVTDVAPPKPAATAEPEPAPTILKPRPDSTSTFARQAVQRPVHITRPTPVVRPAAPPSPVPPPARDQEGFTLRFESDLVLTRLVAAGQVGFFAIAAGRAQRMAVSDSRISFWDASTPNSFHEMEASTVPGPVIDALLRTGANSGAVKWGVTLPGRLRSQLSTLMQEHSGGALVIGAGGNLALDAS